MTSSIEIDALADDLTRDYTDMPIALHDDIAFFPDASSAIYSMIHDARDEMTDAQLDIAMNHTDALALAIAFRILSILIPAESN